MALTKEKLISVLQTDDFKSVHTLKLDGLELTYCFKLLVQEFGVNLFLLTLKNNSLTDIDISLGFTNLRKLDLSSNLLVSVGTKELWETMPRLQILYLHDNLLEDWNVLDCLSTLPSVLHLTLFNNPCIHLPDYRKFIITALPGLLALDFYIATQEERVGIMIHNPENAKIWIQDSCELKNFRRHLYKLRRKWEKCSPVIRIQSLWRRYCVRKHIGGHLSERDKKAVLIQKHVRGWLLRKKLKRDLEQFLRDTNNEDLLFSPEEYVYYKAVRKIEEWYKVCKERKDRKKKLFNASTKIRACYKKFKACQIQIPLLNYTKIYLLKSQQRTLICFLRAIAKDSQEYHPANNIEDRVAPEFFENLPKKLSGPSFSSLFERMQNCTSIKVIRFPDIETLGYSPIPLLQMVKWMPNSKIVNSWHSRPIKGISISSKFCEKHEYEILKKFKNRGSTWTRAEKAKFSQIVWNFDDYQDLMEFNAPTSEILREIIVLVLEYNKLVSLKDLPIFLPIYEVMLNRVKAACTIQSCWRGQKSRKVHKIAEKAIKRRAVYSIQRWWRMQKFFYRMKSLIFLKNLLGQVTSSTLYLQEHLFQNLQSFWSPFTFIEQDFSYFCRGEHIYLSTSSRESMNLLPEWVGTNVQIDQSDYFPSEEERTLQAIILSGAKIEIVTLYSQIQESRIADSNMKFIKLEYNSIEEAKRRISVLYLKTLDHGTRSFIPLFSIKDLRHPFLMSKLRKIWNSRKIKYDESCPAINILAKALSPIDSNYIIPKPPLSRPSLKPRLSERIFEMASETEVVVRNTISSQELLRKRVKQAREENMRRQTESRISKRMEIETKLEEFREEKEHIQEIMSFSPVKFMLSGC